MKIRTKNKDQWISECRQVLKSNLPDEKILTKLPFRYTSPAKEKGTYLPQWLWDSCFHAIVYRWFDPVMAWEELQSLIVHQAKTGDDAGMIPHMTYLAENNDLYNQKLFNHTERSILTQPPLIAIAALEVNNLNPNRDILEKLFGALKDYHDWFDRRRDPENEHLAAILHPWESGWDVSQRWDHRMGLNGSQPDVLDRLAKKRLELVDVILKYNCDATKLSNLSNGFYVKPIDFNAIRAADLDALAEIAHLIGKSEIEVNNLKQRANQIRKTIQEKMIHINDGKLYAPDMYNQIQKKSFFDSAAKFILLFGKCVTTQQAELLKNDLFEERGYFNTPYQVPTTPANNPTFDGNEYWRGNIWIPVNWLIFKGLISYGFVNEAKRLAQNSIDLVSCSGYCEFFDPITGRRGKTFGIECPKNQSWSTLILDMLMTSLSTES